LFFLHWFLEKHIQKTQNTHHYTFLAREREKGNAGTNFPKSSKLTFPSEGGQKSENRSLKNRKKNVSFWGQIRISSNFSLRQGRCFCKAPLTFKNIKTRGKAPKNVNKKTMVFDQKMCFRSSFAPLMVNLMPFCRQAEQKRHWRAQT